jgi:ligand-binding sensor domain-containing protein
MKPSYFLIALSLCISFLAQAQIPMGSWKFHVASAKAIDIVTDGERVFTALENGLYIYNPYTEEGVLKTALNGLSDIEISCLYHDPIDDAIYIGYTNGNIDKWLSGNITNLPAIKLAQISNSKRINKFERFGNFIYVANDFSIVLIDVAKEEIKDTYYPTNSLEAIVDVAITQDSIFALTPTQMLKGLRSNPALPDYSQWDRDLRFPFQTENQYSELQTFSNQFWVLRTNDAYGQDSVFRLDNNLLINVINEPFSYQISSIQVIGTQMAISTDGGILFYSPNGVQINAYTSGLIDRWINPSRICKLGNSFWSADQEWGLLEHINAFTCKRFSIEGLANPYVYTMDWQEGVLAVGSGRLEAEIAPAFTRNGIHILEENEWRFHNTSSVSAWDFNTLWDFITVAVNPKNPKELAAGTYSFAPLTLFNEADTLVFDATNSPLQPVSIGNGWSLVSGLKFDQKGNLWTINGYTDRPIKVRQANGTWSSYYLGPGASNKMTTKIEIDFQDNIWMGTYANGLIGLQHQGTLDDPSDDKIIQLTTGDLLGALPSNKITALAADFDGELWIGTDAGFAVLYNANGSFSAGAGNYDAQRILIPFEGNYELVLGDASITDIEIDGGNRKWIALSNAGLVLLSPDGTQIIAQYNEDNSPLISNTIFDIELNHTTGELYIVTDKGLVSFRIDATYEDPTYESLQVFPNPVRPEYFGPITIQGIRYNSDVKITDAAGNLIYKTQSNGGTATWDGQNLNGEKVPTGVYFFWTANNYQGGERKVAKVLVIR